MGQAGEALLAPRVTPGTAGDTSQGQKGTEEFSFGHHCGSSSLLAGRLGSGGGWRGPGWRGGHSFCRRGLRRAGICRDTRHSQGHTRDTRAQSGTHQPCLSVPSHSRVCPRESLQPGPRTGTTAAPQALLHLYFAFPPPSAAWTPWKRERFLYFHRQDVRDAAQQPSIQSCSWHLSPPSSVLQPQLQLFSV